MYLDPRGAGVSSVVLNKFQQTDLNDDLGQPLWEVDKEGNRIPVPLELVPGGANADNPSSLLYLYDPLNPADARPLDTLAKRDWKHSARVDDETQDGRKRQSVSFTTELPEWGLTLTKTYTLIEGEYHIGLEVKLAMSKEGRERAFRYQLTGAHGLPVEGKWYTSIFRNALIAEEEKNEILARLPGPASDRFVGRRQRGETATEPHDPLCRRGGAVLRLGHRCR